MHFVETIEEAQLRFLLARLKDETLRYLNWVNLRFRVKD